MVITSKQVIALANATPEKREELLKGEVNWKGIIEKAKTLMGKSPVDKEQNDKLDDLIGQCLLPRAKELHGDAMELI